MERKEKISKRKDPEAAVDYYHKEGIPSDAVNEYLMNIINSGFEGWRRANPDKKMSEFKLELSKMGVSGAVFDMVKLLDVSKNIIAKYSAKKFTILRMLGQNNMMINLLNYWKMKNIR